jgi:anaerobic selenocysteine-containing dehydrogenase
VLERLARETSEYSTQVVSKITGAPEHLIRQAVQLIAGNRPVAHYLYNGMVQHTNASQACRAIEIFYALLGDFDQPGGNVVSMPPRSKDIAARALLPATQSNLRLGLGERPLGPPARPGNIAAFDLYSAILDHQPYRVRALVSFGGNTIIANGDSLRGRAALQNLEFFAQAELFYTPTSQYADVLLPAASFMEGEALFVSDGLYTRGDGTAQRRPQIVAPMYERRGDVDVIFDLACRLGLGQYFGGGDKTVAYDEILEPVGLTWETLREHESVAVRVSEPRRYAKYAEPVEFGVARGFATPTRKIELYSEAFVRHGQSPFPAYVEPAESPVQTPHTARQYPLVLTNAKRPQYLHSQHRAIASIRRTMPHPTAELHPETAAQYGIQDGQWIAVETPRGRVRAVADVTPSIMPGIVCANHGWWEGCEELGLPAMDPFSESGGNLNLLVYNDKRDPVSGSVPHRSSLCRIRPADD